MSDWVAPEPTVIFFLLLLWILSEVVQLFIDQWTDLLVNQLIDLSLSLSHSRTRTRPNTRPPPTALTPAVPPVPTRPTAVSWLWMDWTWIPEAPPPWAEWANQAADWEFKFDLMILLWRGKSELPAAFTFVGFYLLGSPAPGFNPAPCWRLLCLTFDLSVIGSMGPITFFFLNNFLLSFIGLLASELTVANRWEVSLWWGNTVWINFVKVAHHHHLHHVVVVGEK